MQDFCSIIMLTFRNGLNDREKLSKECIKSLVDFTDYPYELILIDNTWNNRGFSVGRNRGIDAATGKYVAFVDDDILFIKPWLAECISMIEKGDKYMATPVIQPRIGKWEKESVDGYRCNYRTGSNCMVMRRTALDQVGRFSEDKNVATAGMWFADRISRNGFSFLITKESLAKDMGLNRHSYDRTH